MRGAGSAFLIVRFEAGQVRVIVPMAHCLLSNSRPIRGLLRGITASKVSRILNATAEAAWANSAIAVVIASNSNKTLKQKGD